MNLIGIVLLLGTSASAASAACADDPCFAGFKDVPGIASLCSGFRPTTTVDVTVSGVATITTTITAPYYRYTVYSTTPAHPTVLPACSRAAKAVKAAPAIESGFIKSRTVPGPAPTPTLAPRAPQCCPPVKEGLSKACSCFFPPGPQQTATRTITKADSTYTTTATTTSYNYQVLAKTIVAGCEPSQAPVFGSASYAVCGSQGIPATDVETCPVAKNDTAPPFTVLSEDCCSACANTKDCFQAYTDAASNTCQLDIRRKADTVNHNVTTDCPNAHTFVLLGSQVGVEGGASYFSGFLSGHCAQGC